MAAGIFLQQARLFHLSCLVLMQPIGARDVVFFWTTIMYDYGIVTALHTTTFICSFFFSRGSVPLFTLWDIAISFLLFNAATPQRRADSRDENRRRESHSTCFSKTARRRIPNDNMIPRDGWIEAACFSCSEIAYELGGTAFFFLLLIFQATFAYP